MAEATQTQEQLGQELNKTDFGHLVYENRKLLLGLLAAIIVGVTGYLLWKQNRESAAIDVAEQVFKFQSTTWAEAKNGKLAPDALVKSFSSLPADVKQAPGMLPVTLEMGKFLSEKGSYTEAESILSQAGASNHMNQFFIGMQRAVVLEKLGKDQEAISVLEKIDSGKEDYLPQKIWLELGRLYMKTGQKAKAQTMFDNIVAKFPNDDFAKVAKLYLAQLAQQ